MTTPAPSQTPRRNDGGAGVTRPGSAGMAPGASRPGFMGEADEGAPKCRCGESAVKRTVRKEGPNKGKEFFVCRKPQGGQCRYFEWASTVVAAARREGGGWNKGKWDGGKRDGRGWERMSRGEGKREGEQIGGVMKRPRSGSGGQVEVGLESMDALSFQLGFNSSDELKAAVKEFEGLKCQKTGFLGVEKFVVPVDKMTELENYLEATSGVSVVYKIPRTTIARIIAFRDAERKRENSGDVVKTSLDKILPSIMCEKLMDFQWDGIHFALKRGCRCLIGDDMGLGKTIQAIAVAKVYMADWPLLIVCPSSLRLNWKEELLRWLEDEVREFEINVIMTGKDIENPIERVNIVSYDLLRKIPAHSLRLCKFIVADESHYLKSMSAKRSQALTPLIKEAKRALLLSGTPALSRPVELFPQINAICPILFPLYQEFVQRYCAAHMGRFGYDVSGASNLDELHTLLRGSVLIRRKKEEVLSQLPEKQRQVIWVQTKPVIMRKISQSMAELEVAKAAADNARSEAESAKLQNAVKKIQNELYSTTGEAKLDSVMEFCKDTAETGCKFIVFVHHAEVMDRLDEYVSTKLRLGRIRIDGNTAQGARQSLCREFQEHQTCRVALLSITAAGVGLTLTKATVVLFAELYWNPGSLLQAEDRAHRIGQRDCVLVKYLLAKQTLDEPMWNTVRRKLTVVGHSLTGAAARMDLTENKDSKEPKKEAIENFFKPRATQAKVTSREAKDDDEAIEIVDEPIQTPYNSLSVESAERRPNKAAQDEIVFPMSLSELEVMSDVPEEVGGHIERNRHPDDVDLAKARARQAQMDADIALAQKLQAQFDSEAEQLD